MGRVRGIGVAGIIALIAVPAIALAAHGQAPVPGTWTASFPPNPQPGGFVLAGGSVTSLTAVVAGQYIPSSCPTGSVTVPGPIAIKHYKHIGWAFGKFGFITINRHHVKRFEEAPVTATLNGQPVRNVALELEFDSGGARNGRLVRAAGILDLDVSATPRGYTSSACAESIGEFRPVSNTSGS
jgi:hypothetical protein